MTLLAALRQSQRTRVRTALGLLIAVLPALVLQACTMTPSATESPADRAVASAVLDVTSIHSGHVPAEQCPFCPDCEHAGCAEHASCDGPVVVGTKAQTSLPDAYKFGSTAAAANDAVEAAFTSQNTFPNVQPSDRVVAAAVPVNIRYCVYLM